MGMGDLFFLTFGFKDGLCDPGAGISLGDLLPLGRPYVPKLSLFLAQCRRGFSTRRDTLLSFPHFEAVCEALYAFSG
jgi:hypothetical protein